MKKYIFVFTGSSWKQNIELTQDCLQLHCPNPKNSHNRHSKNTILIYTDIPKLLEKM